VRVIGRGLLVLALVAAGVGLAVAPADAAPARSAAVTAAYEDTHTHRLTVQGWADNPAHPRASIQVAIFADGRRVRTVRANRGSPRVNAAHHLRGRHAFRLDVTLGRVAGRVTARPIRNNSVTVSRRVRHITATPGQRIIAIARQFVGARYVEGGATPRGFDCSGFTEYVYARAHVHALPHNAEGQRRMKGMRRISRRAARPGDLVFYLSGGIAYHVAIYAGRGMQYAAATPRDGVRYQGVWSTNVQYATDWH
jgi:cell wall-associated NlpC family hydrolase